MLTGEPIREESAVRGEYGDCDLLIGVNRVRGDTSGEQRYLSLQSVSVPYPLSMSAGRARRCFTVFTLSGVGLQYVFRASTGDVIDLYTLYDWPCSRNRFVSCVQYCTVAGSMRNFAKPGSLGWRQMEGKSLPKTGVSAHRMS